MSGVPVSVIVGDGTPWTELRIVTPLGIRFRDIALEEPVGGGLTVLVQPRDIQSGPRQLSPNPSGIFGFHALPGLHDIEYPRSLDAPPVSSPPSGAAFVVMVSDRLGRFLPSAFGLELPLPFVTSPPLADLDPDPAPVLDAYLFTAPTRPVTCGFAALRADLLDVDADPPAPAAYARVIVTVGDRARIGLADERGRLLVLVPWPLLERLRLGSPPGSGQPPPYEQTWPITLEVWYRPNLPPPFDGDAVLPEPWTDLPGLKGMLEHTDRAFIWPSPAGPAVTTWSGAITYGRELVARTDTQSELWISRGASPP